MRHLSTSLILVLGSQLVHSVPPLSSISSVNDTYSFGIPLRSGIYQEYQNKTNKNRNKNKAQIAYCPEPSLSAGVAANKLSGEDRLWGEGGKWRSPAEYQHLLEEDLGFEPRSPVTWPRPQDPSILTWGGVPCSGAFVYEETNGAGVCTWARTAFLLPHLLHLRIVSITQPTLKMLLAMWACWTRMLITLIPYLQTFRALLLYMHYLKTD